MGWCFLCWDENRRYTATGFASLIGTLFVIALGAVVFGDFSFSSSGVTSSFAVSSSVVSFVNVDFLLIFDRCEEELEDEKETESEEDA